MLYFFYKRVWFNKHISKEKIIIILNQFKHFPNKAVQKAAFVGELRAKMETRKHSKLYMAKVGDGT